MMTKPLSEKIERLLILFKQAIDGERNAQKLYSEMLSNCDDPELRTIIESFLVSEQAHEKTLLTKYKELRATENYKD
jgi:rubrerythrin